MRKFKKIPVTIEAMEYTGENFDELKAWCKDAYKRVSSPDEIVIKTLEDGKDMVAKHVATTGDFIIKGVKGEFYPCKPIIFWLTYEEVLEAFDPAL